MGKHIEDSISGQAAEGPLEVSLLNTGREMGSSAWGIPRGTDLYHASRDASLFSSSLPVLPHEKLNFTNAEHYDQYVDDNLPIINKIEKENEGQDPLKDIETNPIGNILPDDEEELLAGIMDDFDLSRLPSQLEDLDENDLFGSGGGLELDFEPQESLGFGISKLSLLDGDASNGVGSYVLSNGAGPVAGEHPYGEHPSRTLFVRNINSNVEDFELRSLFEDNPSEKDINQGTLVVFNLDASVSNDDLRQIFGAYGEVKEIRETPHKRHHKFIEFYDVRAAEEALKALNQE
ncbi:Protein MEI2-like [Quillaja saponaria]|uniref:Protein MEI2-like n=1 Tax=Quillaja saponaria TaxID=32244 RepID=A0AAD7LVQ1_QUISA|nr:Protein MEI2-like [Quillaja saponaria]